jgi:hypothetical protein
MEFQQDFIVPFVASFSCLDLKMEKENKFIVFVCIFKIKN